LHFFIFWKIFAPLEAKMMKNDKKMKKKMKKNEENPRKIAIFHFLENCNFPRFFSFFFIFFSFFHFFFIFSSFFIIFHQFHHWKQK